MPYLAYFLILLAHVVVELGTALGYTPSSPQKLLFVNTRLTISVLPFFDATRFSVIDPPSPHCQL